MEAEKQYPSMTPIFSAIQDREKHRKLIIAVCEIAKEWPDNYDRSELEGDSLGLKLFDAAAQLIEFEANTNK